MSDTSNMRSMIEPTAAPTPEQMRELADNLSYVNFTSNDDAVSCAVTALREAADQIEAVTAQRAQWAAQVIAIEAAVDRYGYDDEAGTAWLPLAPIVAVLHPGEQG